MSGGGRAAILAFAAAAATIVGLAFGLALVVARAEKTTVERLEAAAPQVKGWAGVVLLVIGTWMLVLGLFADAFAKVFAV